MLWINQSAKPKAAASGIKSHEINWEDMQARSSFHENEKKDTIHDLIDWLAGQSLLRNTQ